MTIQCPACSKENDAAATSDCARCGCDLSMLRQIAAAAAAHLRRALETLTRAEWPLALAHAQRSWELVHTRQSAQAACLAAAATGDLRALTGWRRRAEDAGGPCKLPVNRTL